MALKAKDEKYHDDRFDDLVEVAKRLDRIWLNTAAHYGLKAQKRWSMHVKPFRFEYIVSLCKENCRDCEYTKECTHIQSSTFFTG
jgi:hypothetical protein